MSVTAKEIAKELNISAAAVSMALNNKPGVSTKTRKIIFEKAREMGYDFSKLTPAEENINYSDCWMFNVKGTDKFIC